MINKNQNLGGSRARGWYAYLKAAEEWDAEDLQGFPRGMPTTQADTINADLLAFLKA